VSIAPHVLVTEPLAGRVAGAVVALTEDRVHHLRRVLRLAEGDALSLTDGAGASADAQLVGDGARLSADAVVAATSGMRLVLAQALSKGRRAEDAVRTACELGVDRLVPVVAERTQGRPDARGAQAVLERWSAVAAAALEQSRGVRLVAVDEPIPTRALATRPAGAGAVRLVAVPGATPLPEVLREVLPEVLREVPGDALVGEVVVAIGPEGGWSPQEVDGFVAAGWHPVGLGPTVLRTEHAGPAAVAVIAAAAGRWSAAAVPQQDAAGEPSTGGTL
jgi:16S rRNA (uracil1498-N3)-methyltransferase